MHISEYTAEHEHALRYSTYLQYALEKLFAHLKENVHSSSAVPKCPKLNIKTISTPSTGKWIRTLWNSHLKELPLHSMDLRNNA